MKKRLLVLLSFIALPLMALAQDVQGTYECFGDAPDNSFNILKSNFKLTCEDKNKDLLEYSGTWQLHGDTLWLIQGVTNNVLAQFRLSATHDTIHLLFSMNGILEDETRQATHNYYRTSALYENGQNHWVKEVKKAFYKTGAPKHYIYTAYDRNGNMLLYCVYRDAKKQGEELVYYPQPKSTCNYSETEDAPVAERHYWQGGMKSGDWRFYDTKGTLIREEWYENDKLVKSKEHKS